MADNPVILITRPEPQASRFATALAKALPDAEIRVVPLAEVVVTGEPIKGGDWRTVAFTSETGVRAAAELWQGPKGTAYTVGDRTAEVATALGWRSVSAGGDGTALVRLIADAGVSDPVLWPSGDAVRDSFPEQAKALGLSVVRRVVYRVQPTGGVLDADGPVILPIFSPASAERARAALAPGVDLHVVAISQAAASVFAGQPVTVAEAPTGAAMIRAISQAYRHAVS